MNNSDDNRDQLEYTLMCNAGLIISIVRENESMYASRESFGFRYFTREYKKIKLKNRCFIAIFTRYI